MDVYLFVVEGQPTPVFYGEVPATPHGVELDERGRLIRNRADRWLRWLQAAWLRAERRAGPLVRRFGARLDRRRPPDEELLRGLRSADSIRILHPSSWSDHKVHQAWRRYLNRRWGTHLGPLLWDLLIAPLIALLMFLPGPNVIGYWLLFRVLSHVLALRGIARVRRRRFPVATEPRPELEAPLHASNRPEDAKRLSEIFPLRRIGQFLRRLHARAPGTTVAGR